MYMSVMSDATTLMMMLAVCPSTLNSFGMALLMASVTSFCLKNWCISWRLSSIH